MAFEKSSKKTQKTKAEVPAKTKTSASVPKGRTSEPILEAKAKNATEVAATKIRRKSSSAVVKVDSALQNNVVTYSNGDVPKTMAAAAAGHASTDTTAQNHSTAAENGIEVGHGHATGHTNGSTNGHTREAIAQRAYFYWAERGFTHGAAEEDWKRAEADLMTK